MAMEVVHVGHQLSLAFLCCDAAHCPAHWDSEASMGALIGSNDQHGPIPGAKLVETL